MFRASGQAALHRDPLERCAKASTVPAHYSLRLYIAGQSPRSVAALANLKAICEQHLAGRYELEVVDVLLHPERAEAEGIIATPTLLVLEPFAGRRIVGDLSATGQVLVGLGLRRHLWTWRRKI